MFVASGSETCRWPCAVELNFSAVGDENLRRAALLASFVGWCKTQADAVFDEQVQVALDELLGSFDFQ